MFDFLLVAENDPGNAERGLADIGQFDASAVTHKKFGAVAFLELLDLARKRWLGDMEHFSRAGEAAMGGDRVE